MIDADVPVSTSILHYLPLHLTYNLLCFSAVSFSFSLQLHLFISVQCLCFGLIDNLLLLFCVWLLCKVTLRMGIGLPLIMMVIYLICIIIGIIFDMHLFLMMFTKWLNSEIQYYFLIQEKSSITLNKWEKMIIWSAQW